MSNATLDKNFYGVLCCAVIICCCRGCVGGKGQWEGSTALSQHTLRSVANRGNFSLIVLMMAAWGSAMSEPLSDIPHAASGVSVSSPACCYITVVCTIKVYIMVENKRGGGKIDV